MIFGAALLGGLVFAATACAPVPLERFCKVSAALSPARAETHAASVAADVAVVSPADVALEISSSPRSVGYLGSLYFADACVSHNFLDDGLRDRCELLLENAPETHWLQLTFFPSMLRKHIELFYYKLLALVRIYDLANFAHSFVDVLVTYRRLPTISRGLKVKFKLLSELMVLVYLLNKLF